ncbi:MAG TPA: LysM peptidoglycan-binding domain-containing protein [Jatrophihabitans sp.]|nr:LysM peptidoglycan-binding domain-containing protein [Jatrophihabitans sp.]
MSVATEFPPAVYIPERARPVTGGVPLHLALVPAAGRLSTAGAAPRRLVGPALSAAERRFGDSRLDWPLTVTPPPAAAPLRLTRRGLLALVLATALTGLVLLAVAWASAPGASAGAHSGSVGSVMVQPGDTLWSIAQRTAPQRDPRQVVDQLRRLNHLNSVALTPGQTLKLG